MQQKINSLLQQLTLDEKIALCAGKDFWHTVNIDRLNIPSIKLNDGPHGVRATDSADIIVTDNQHATCFPTASALASSWSPELVGKVATAIGHEARFHGVHLLLGPGINLKRSPLGGRNFEYYSEDPYLTATLASAFVKALQATGVGASLKHFVANEQEVERMTIDCIVDDRALHEVYLQPFAAVIKEAKPLSVMAAYNKLNGEKIAESPRHLQTLLRETLGFDGAIVSDWGAVADVAAAMRATLDLDMPRMGDSQSEALSAMLAAGDLTEAELDVRVRRILALVFAVAFDPDEPVQVDFDRHHTLATQAAEESIVLLKNETNTLPLSSDINDLGVVGALYQQPRIQGGGSSKVSPYKVSTPADALAEHYPHITIDYAQGYAVDSETFDEQLIADAAGVVRRHKTNLIFLGLLPHEETEGRDRLRYALSDQQQTLLRTLLAIDPHLIVILNNGTAVTFEQLNQVETLVEVWLAGQAVGEALINVLFGQVNPSGKLAETFPISERDFPLNTTVKSSNQKILYSESVLVGHRFYDARQMPVAFPFGHGLSYTEFSYSNLTTSAEVINSQQTLQLSFDIENTGSMAGKEIAQLYIEHCNPSILKPPKTLRHYAKVDLAAGESTTVNFTLTAEDFHYYHDSLEKFFVDAGIYQIHIGRSSRDIQLTAELEITHSPVVEAELTHQLTRESIGQDFLIAETTRVQYEQTFGYLDELGLYEIALDMPLDLLNRLFPELITKETLDNFMKELHA